MGTITRNALRNGAASLAMLLAASTSAEVHRFTKHTMTVLIQESGDVPAVRMEPEAMGEDADVHQPAFSTTRLIERLPQLVTVGLAGDAEALPATVTAVFAVEPPDGPSRGKMALDFGLVKVQGVYAVAQEDQARLAAWLGVHADQFVGGEVVIDRLEGWDAPATVHLGGTVLGRSFIERAERLQGRTLPDVAFSVLNGGAVRDGAPEIRFGDLAGDVVLVHVWGTWCAPCLRKMAGLEALQASHRDRGLVIVNVSDEPAPVQLEWLAQNASAMLYGRRDDLSFLAGPGRGRPAGVPRPMYLVLDRAGGVREVQVGVVVGMDADAPAGNVDHLRLLVERYL